MSTHVTSPQKREYQTMRAESEKKMFRLPFAEKAVQVYTRGYEHQTSTEPVEHLLIEGQFRTLRTALEAGRKMLKIHLEMGQEIDKIGNI